MEQPELSALPPLLLAWYAHSARDLPWRRDREPYHVWLSEIMLQQTRVEAVRGYYARFLAALPTVADLAAAEPDTLTKLWEGLGYYSRVRNLHRAAQQIMTQHGGVFPRTYAEVRALPGVGPYTAGAICSICFGMPEPAVDGNVLRVISRLTDSDAPIDLPATRRAVEDTLREIYPRDAAGSFTQALMELGATVCIPNGAPDCGVCPAAALCAARRAGRAQALPVKSGKKPRRVAEMTVLHLRCGDRIAFRRRAEKGLLAGLWEYPNAPGQLSAEEALAFAASLGVHPTDLRRMAEKTHIFTHIEWHMRCYYLECAEEAPGLTWADAAQRRTQIALPTAFRIFSEDTP